MSLYKRGSTWWINFTTPSGERVRRSAETRNRAEALELHDKLKAEFWRSRQLGERPGYTWDDASRKWLHETVHKRTHCDDLRKLAWLRQFLQGRALAAITRDEIAAIGGRKTSEASGATANRYLALVRAIMRKACFEWEWIEKVPKVKMYRESKRRVRWITPDQARTLLAELPEHQRDMVLFALATGLRQGNVTGLRWMQLDLDRKTGWIGADEAKGGEDIHLSLSDLAMDVLTRQLGSIPSVFLLTGVSQSLMPTRRHGAMRFCGLVSRTSAGTTYVILGRAGWFKAVLRCTTCRRWVVGSRSRWCGGTHTWPQPTWRVTPP